MKILVVGSGGREHAICWAFARSGRVSKIFCAPGNAGIENIAECVPLAPEGVGDLVKFARDNSIDLTFIGGETALALGVVDSFEASGLKIIGASKKAAQLEASKVFAKDFMKRHGVPTAEYAAASSPTDAISILETAKFGGPEAAVVVKADGLAAGKGVVVAANRAEAVLAINNLYEIAGTEAAAQIVLEECLIGREVSLLMFADGEDFDLMPPTRDHKRIGEGDTGPNTGGMGTITDSSLLTGEQLQDIVDTIIRPTLRGCIEEGFRFRGILFLGLMMTENGPKLLEYNVRFGDPETQSILVRLESDLVDICEAMLDGRLNRLEVNWRNGNSATVVLAAEGYPHSPRKGDVVSGLDEASAVHGVTIFHAGTTALSAGVAIGDKVSQSSRKVLTAGGRVLGVTAVADSLEGSLRAAYTAVDEISWDGLRYRRDIGK